MLTTPETTTKPAPQAASGECDSNEKFEGFLLGLLIASYICEIRAGDRPSHNAMAIMRYRQNAQLAAEQGRPLPDWRHQ